MGQGRASEGARDHQRTAFRTTLAVYGGEAYLGVNKARQAEANVTADNRVTTALESDDAPRNVAAPDALVAALGRAKLHDRFEALAPSHREEPADWVASGSSLTPAPPAARSPSNSFARTIDSRRDRPAGGSDGLPPGAMLAFDNCSESTRAEGA